METGQTRAQFSIPSIIALVAAIASFFVGAMAGFILALTAILFGIIGAVMSLSPGVRGGIVSILSLLIAAVAIFAAVIKALAWIF
jgi:hypothetical protein